MDSFTIAEAKARLSEIVERVANGEEVLLTQRGSAVARITPVPRATNILGAGRTDPNIDNAVIARDEWWQPKDSHGE